ncbi:aldo/keto reductase [Amylibacter sp.]|jgi:D-threo-aldose 1-dehydrogenase|nr:aldo/keto reductase [Amylibacter sp.]
MEYVTIPKTDLKISKFIFGTASLHHVAKPIRQKLLDAVIDCGFSHFDTAPYYSYGTAERSLYDILKKNKDASVTTKVGLFSPGGENQSETQMYIRKIVGKFIPKLSKAHIDFSIQSATKSLDNSRRRLGRDCIDIFLMHEPMEDLFQTDEWCAWFQSQVKLGNIRNYGIAGEKNNLNPILNSSEELANIIQTRDSIIDKNANFILDSGRDLQITYGYFANLISNNRNIITKNLLDDAVKRNSSGAIIMSTTKLSHLSYFKSKL